MKTYDEIEQERLSNEDIANLVHEISMLNQRYDAYKTELEVIGQAIIEKTKSLSTQISEPMVIVRGERAIPVAYDKNNKRVVVQDPILCINL
jgi:cob(I)alamin adenosyltransferase